jgi:ribosome recycling factor
MYNEVHKRVEEKMKKTVSVYQNELVTVRAGRANPSILNKITVDYYGAATPLKQIANITVPEPRMLQISPYDITSLADIEKAILVSDLGLNPSNDGKIIRLIIPQLTEDRRKDLVKSIKKMAENARVAIRNERRQANDELKKLLKSNELTEDDVKAGEKTIQDLTDSYVKEIEKLLESKEKELMEV